MKIDSEELRDFLKDNACAVGMDDKLLYADTDKGTWEDVIELLEKHEEARQNIRKHNSILYILNIIITVILVVSSITFESKCDTISFIISILSGLYLIFFMLINYK